jgi:CubicO group peptidase (beta-lactamase class C family)
MRTWSARARRAARNVELVFTRRLTAEGITESLATFEFLPTLARRSSTSNQMIAAAATPRRWRRAGSTARLYDTSAEPDGSAHLHPGSAWTAPRSSLKKAGQRQLRGSVRAVYGLLFEPLPFEVEETFFVPIAPASAAWSTVLDLAKYMIMELDEGVAADGTRIVSSENLAHTWEPQIAMSALDEYGLGWIVSDFDGLQMLSHAGNTFGFTTEFAFLPDHDLGVVVLTNQRLSFLNDAVLSRLVEMLFEQPYTADEAFRFSFNLFRDQYLENRDKSERMADPEAVALSVGSFTNDALGDVTINLNSEGVLIFNAGEFQSELWSATADEDKGEDGRRSSFCSTIRRGGWASALSRTTPVSTG